MRPYLDYGDVIYHTPAKVCEFSHIILQNLMEKLEAIQYSAALAVTGTWRGTSRQKLYAELGWESLPVGGVDAADSTTSSVAIRSSQSGCYWANKGKNSFYPNCISE